MIEPGEYGMGLKITNDAAEARMCYDRETGRFWHAFLRVVGTPEQLIRLGVCRRAKTRTGVSPVGRLRADGRVLVEVFSTAIIPRDTRFQQSMRRVLEGAPCVDFSLPKRPEAA